MALVIGTTYSADGSSTGNNRITAGIDYILVSQNKENLTSKIRIFPWFKKEYSSTLYNLNNQTLTGKVGTTTKTAVTSFNMSKATTNEKTYVTNNFPFIRRSGSMNFVDEKYCFEVDVKHNSDGTLNNLNLYCEIPLKVVGYLNNSIVNINVDLPRIILSATCTMPNFTIGDTIEVVLNNTVSAYGYKMFWYINEAKFSYFNEVFGEDGIIDITLDTGNAYNFKQKLYEMCPNNQEVNTYFVVETYTDKTYTNKLGTTQSNIAKMKINVNECIPTFDDFDYRDTKSEIINLTGDNQKIIKGYSNVECIIPVSKRADAKNFASIVKYELPNDAIADYSATDETMKEIGIVSTNTVTVTARDSRQLSKSITKALNIIDYQSQTITNFIAERANGVSEQGELSVNGKYWNGNFGLGDNTIVTVKYRIKKSTETNYSSWYDITIPFKNRLDVTSITNEMANYTVNNLPIYSDGISSGFMIGVSYDVQIIIVDGIIKNANKVEFDNIIRTAQLQDGKFLDAVYKDSDGNYHMGINGMPRDDATLTIYGNLKINNQEIGGSNIAIKRWGGVA